METPPSTPKRKRPGIVTIFQAGTYPATPSPQRTADSLASDQEQCVSASPRTLVANRLALLEVRGQSIDGDVETLQCNDHRDARTEDDEDDEEVLRKKFRVRDGSPIRARACGQGSGSVAAAETHSAAEQATPLLKSKPEPRNKDNHATQCPDAVEGGAMLSNTASKAQPQRSIKQPRPKTSKRPKSPPPPTGVAPVSPASVYTLNTDAESTEPPIGSESQKSDGKGIDQSHATTPNNFTWHDSEITGHLGLDPDDDGTGINGIGFRPTAQQTYARMQKRKQQVKEWREREGREARDRRREARVASGTVRAQKAAIGESKIGLGGRRTVRFAGSSPHDIGD